MILYLDTSFLASVFVADRFSERAKHHLLQPTSSPLLSDFASAEFSSVLSRLARTKEISVADAYGIFIDFDIWTAQRVSVTSADIAAANVHLRRFDTTLRAPDAIHLAMAQRLGGELATFDDGLAESARRLNVPLAAL